ncbi:hypothetical protein B0H11DRAFT_1955838 [Mycena galericulata]|nr:hypothetical protein B0H11DRAFT_1955838 [Mycena galericulata]
MVVRIGNGGRSRGFRPRLGIRAHGGLCGYVEERFKGGFWLGLRDVGYFAVPLAPVGLVGYGERRRDGGEGFILESILNLFEPLLSLCQRPFLFSVGCIRRIERRRRNSVATKSVLDVFKALLPVRQLPRGRRQIGRGAATIRRDAQCRRFGGARAQPQIRGEKFVIGAVGLARNILRKRPERHARFTRFRGFVAQRREKVVVSDRYGWRRV